MRAEALNALLPADVAVLACAEAARRLRRAPRRPRAHLLLPRAAHAGSAAPFERGRALWWPHRLDRDALARVRGAARRARTTSRRSRRPRPTTCASSATSLAAALGRGRRRARVRIEADTFMRHMNRVLVGTMLEVAGGRRPLEDFARAARRAPHRRDAGPTAPPHGLYLAGVRYGGRAAVSRSGRTPPARRMEARMNVLLTNDDGIDAEGLQALRRALRGRPRRPAARHRAGRQPLGDGALITTRRPLWVAGGRRSTTARSATRPTARPSTACASASCGLVEDFEPRARSSPASTTAPTWATTSPTRARSRRRSRASSSASRRSPSRSSPPTREMDFRFGAQLRASTSRPTFTARIVAELDDVPLPRGHAAEHQRPRRRTRTASR